MARIAPDELVIPGTWNARDVGGRTAPVSQSAPLRSGVLFRSAQLSELTTEGIAEVDRLDIRTVLDLRAPQEVAGAGADRVPDGTDVVYAPFGVTSRVMVGADPKMLLSALRSATDPAAFGRGIMTDLYRSFVTDDLAHRSVGLSLRTIAAASHGVLVHCTAGKDRTGWIVALVQEICSVRPDEITSEYLRSGATADILATKVAAPTGLSKAAWRSVLAVEPEYLNAGFDEAGKVHGSIRGYLDVIGVDADVREAIRTRFGVLAAEDAGTR